MKLEARQKDSIIPKTPSSKKDSTLEGREKQSVTFSVCSYFKYHNREMERDMAKLETGPPFSKENKDKCF